MPFSEEDVPLEFRDLLNMMRESAGGFPLHVRAAAEQNAQGLRGVFKDSALDPGDPAHLRAFLLGFFLPEREPEQWLTDAVAAFVDEESAGHED